MTYRCVPHRYSYELRSGWKPFAAAWGIGAGDTIVLERHTADRSRLHARVSLALLQEWKFALRRDKRGLLDMLEDTTTSLP